MNRCPLCGSDVASAHGCSTVPPDDDPLTRKGVVVFSNHERPVPALRKPAVVKSAESLQTFVGKPVKRRG